MKKIVCLVFALFLMSLGRAFADYYTFSYVDGTFSASGTLITAPGAEPFTVTGGALNSAAFTAELYTGAGTIPAGTYATSPSGAFYYDNTLSPSSTSILTYPGLLFTVGVLGGAGYNEINIFGNGGVNNYSYYEGTAQGNYPVIYNGGTFTVTEASSVPAPPAAWLLGSGLLGLIGVRRRLKRHPLSNVSLLRKTSFDRGRTSAKENAASTRSNSLYGRGVPVGARQEGGDFSNGDC